MSLICNISDVGSNEAGSDICDIGFNEIESDVNIGSSVAGSDISDIRSIGTESDIIDIGHNEVESVINDIGFNKGSDIVAAADRPGRPDGRPFALSSLLFPFDLGSWSPDGEPSLH